MATAAIETPFGPIHLSVAAGPIEVGGQAESARSFGTEGRILRWLPPELHVELLIVPIESRMPHGQQVERCVVAAWRIAAAGGTGPLRFSALAHHGRWPEGGPASGDRLSAFTWSGDGMELSLGAPDAEGLLYYEDAGIPLPSQWRALVSQLDPAGVVVEEYLDDGLEVRLPHLKRGEVGHFHFVAAWAESASNPDMSWYAVDVSSSTIKSLFDRMDV